ncbi:alpha/beta hydrolase [Sphingosinicella rhizophila]|uniref:Alpha/beta hydrolase fold domain-containing protein n=1 Tax=Sphingosinicella rhizophila TaxID=3050082 RepID=A0ABU3QBD6_9SPHN|nr:alpha/beta hydrolase fold domain-containing protein [Sphingosinicella sp. GR2756]MDT9600265.1 alpha/beta hydrolase fold domain-containing protein [Sphingosinicella sp. GR2756]
MAHWIKTVTASLALFVGSALFPTGGVSAQGDEKPAPVERNGTVNIAPAAIPFSDLASEQLRDAFVRRTFVDTYPTLAGPITAPGVIAKLRKDLDETLFKPALDGIKTLYPVDIAAAKIAGVSVEIITPKGGVDAGNANRVLISLHGGSFMVGGGLGGRLEAVPIASVGKIKVISVDYRKWPEHKFPAASEDVAAVYAELLKSYKPGSIGIFGCSAGGMLTAGSVAWFQTHGLPAPGAIGIFCASAGNDFEPTGDSRYFASLLNGYPAPPPPAVGKPVRQDGYFEDADTSGPLISPINWPDVLKRFPPTLLLTGTRAVELSGAINTHNKLIRLGVEADLHIWDGAGHAFWSVPDTPEIRESYDVAVRFFGKHLAR